MSERVGPIYDRSDYAGFIRRTIALVIDLFLLAFAGVGLQLLWDHLAPAEWITQTAYDRLWLVWFFGAIAYMVGFRMTARGTPGYQLVGIRYAPVVAEAPSRLSLAYRALVAVILLWGFVFDHFWILVDERKQAWHDKLSGFYVVKRKAVPKGTQRVTRRVINFMTLTFEVWEPAKDR